VPFWTLFWLVFPPVVLLLTVTVYYVLTGRDES